MAGKNPAHIMLLLMKILPYLEDFVTRKIPILLSTFPQIDRKRAKHARLKQKRSMNKRH